MILAVLEPYKMTVLILGLTALMLFVQLLVADIVGIKLGHKPGHAVSGGHRDLHFRVVRAISNSNESVAIFILAVIFALASGANPSLLNGSAAVYFGARLGHMMCYYLNLKLLRSIAFVISLIGLLGVIVSGFLAYFSG